MKWLAALTVLVIAILAVLWLQIGATDAPVVVVKHEAATVAQADGPTALSPKDKIAAVAARLEAENPQPGKIDPRSDAFFYEFDDVTIPNLSKNAVKCYTGGLHRVSMNQHTKLGYDIEIKDGEVSVTNVHVISSNIDDTAMNDCFVREVAKTRWHNDALPNWKQTNEEFKISPERGMKKYMADNLDYEGDGPEQKVPARTAPPSSRDMASREAPDFSVQ